MPRVQDALPSLDCRAWKGRSNPLLLSALRFAPESRSGPSYSFKSCALPPRAGQRNSRQATAVRPRAVPELDLAQKRILAFAEADDRRNCVGLNHPLSPQPRRIDGDQIVLKFALHSSSLARPSCSQPEAETEAKAVALSIAAAYVKIAYIRASVRRGLSLTFV
jgi:hypothetical protein